MGVHEGLSCLACHENHGAEDSRIVCQLPSQLSNCGLDVETMDTTFKSIKSPHNIHFVKCLRLPHEGRAQEETKDIGGSGLKDFMRTFPTVGEPNPHRRVDGNTARFFKRSFPRLHHGLTLIVV